MTRPFDPLDALRAHRQHTFLVLQHAVAEQERPADDGHALAIEQVSAHDDVGDASFVFEREEDPRFEEGPSEAGHSTQALILELVEGQRWPIESFEAPTATDGRGRGRP